MNRSIERVRRREATPEEDVRRRATQGRNCSGSPAKKVVNALRLNEVALNAVKRKGASIRLACTAVDISETCNRHSPRLNDDNAQIADWLIRLTHIQKNCGFGLCYLFLRNVKGYEWHHKRVYRIYRELELNLRIKPGKQLVRAKALLLAVPAFINECWSMGFRHDQLSDSPTFRIFNLIDDYNLKV